MQVYIHVDLQDAIKAGRTQSGWLPVTVTDEFVSALTQEEREAFAIAMRKPPERDGQARANFDPSYSPPKSGPMPEISEATPAALLALIQWRTAELAAEKKEREIKVAKERKEHEDKLRSLLAAGPSAFTYADGSSYADREDAPYPERLTDVAKRLGLTDQLAKVRAQAQEIGQQQEKERQRERREAEERQAKREAEKKAQEEKFQAAWRAWIQQKGTPVQKARLAEDLLTEEEALSAIREELFAWAKGLERYEPIKKNEVDHDDGCYEPAVAFSAAAPESLTDEQYLQLTAMRSRAPETFKVAPRLHKAWCGNDACEDVVERFGALASVTWFGRTLSREYALPDADEPGNVADADEAEE